MTALLDVNILVAAHRRDHPTHAAALAVVDGRCLDGFAWCAHTRNGFLRLVTHPQVFADPTPLSCALDAVEAWRTRPRSEHLPETDAVWTAFAGLCRRHQSVGNAVYDLHLAALAIAHGVELVSSDQGFGRIAGLRWRAP